MCANSRADSEGKSIDLILLCFCRLIEYSEFGVNQKLRTHLGDVEKSMDAAKGSGTGPGVTKRLSTLLQPPTTTGKMQMLVYCWPSVADGGPTLNQHL